VITGVVRGPGGATIGNVQIPVAGTPAPGAGPGPQSRPPLARPRQGRLLAGVAAGTAAHLRQDPLVVRAAFVVLAALGVGVVLYGLLWMTMPVAEPGDEPVVTL
jgi:phage shock protein PspC (stress-responsive transcriptional regulator)